MKHGLEGQKNNFVSSRSHELQRLSSQSSGSRLLFVCRHVDSSGLGGLEKGLGISEKAQNGRRHYDFNATLLQTIDANAKPGSENQDLGSDRSLRSVKKERYYYLTYLI